MKTEQPTDDLHLKVFAWARRAVAEGIDPEALAQSLFVVAVDLELQRIPIAKVADTLREVATALDRRQHIPPSSQRH